MSNFTTMDDATLVEYARQNPDAFGELYRRYLDPVYRYTYHRLGNAHDSEDLTSQVFMEVLEGLMNLRFRKGGCFLAWLFTIARRRTVDFYRQHSVDPLYDLPSSEPGLMAVIEKGEDVRRLGHLLRQLGEEQQELLRLRFTVGLSFADIAQVEGRSEAAVKMAIYRTLEHLRKQWEVENE